MANIWWTPPKIKELVGLLECHASIEDIMVYFNQSESSVRNAIKRHTFGMRLHQHIGAKADLTTWSNKNYPKKPRKKHKQQAPRVPHKWTPDRVEWLKRLAGSGASLKLIAREMDDSLSAIQHALSKHTDGLQSERKRNAQ